MTKKDAIVDKNGGIEEPFFEDDPNDTMSEEEVEEIINSVDD